MVIDVQSLGIKPTHRTSTFIDPTNSSRTIYLEGPTLNISQYYDELWVSPYLPGSLFTFTLLDGSHNGVYDTKYVRQYGTCSPDQFYQWGFSGLFLFFAIILTTIWAIGMWIMWIDAHYRSNLDLYGRQLGGFRAAWDLVQVLQSEIGDVDDIDWASDRAVRRKMQTGKHRATISYAKLVAERATSNRAGRPSACWSLVKRNERWTLLVVALAMIVVISVPASIANSNE